MSYSGNIPQRQMNALDHRQLKLYAKKPENATGAPTLTFKFVNNIPRINLYTNVESDNNRGMVSLQLEAPHFYSFLDAWESVANGKEEKVAIEVKKYTFFKGQRSEERRVIGRLVVGREDNGAVFVGLISNNVTPVKFIPGGGFEITYRNKDGDEMSQKEVSERVSRGWISNLRNYVAAVADTHYIHKEAKRPPNQQRQQQSPNSQPSNNYDDDVAF